MMKTGKNNRFLASILAASMMLTMSPFAFAVDAAEQQEMTKQEQVQPATQNETNANPTVSQAEDQSPKGTNSEKGQPSENVKPAGENTNAGGSTSTSETPTKPETPTEPETPTKPETPENAAKIGENEYPTVADAITAADGSEPIVLLRDRCV